MSIRRLRLSIDLIPIFYYHASLAVLKLISFTITNLGAFEIEGFTPIINPPQIAILGVGHIKAKPVAHHHEVAIRQMLTLSLSFDHRASDGAPAARFLQRIKQLVERPFALML